MRNFIYFVAIILLFNACKKEKEPEYSKTKTMTAKLEGNIWRAVKPKGAISSNLYMITGESKIGHRINIFMNYVGVGTYQLSSTSISKAEYIMPDDGGTYVTKNGSGTSGYIEIKEMNTTNRTVTGRFYFVANKVGTPYLKTISDGKFENIEYYDVSQGVENNSLTASISGSAYSAVSVMGNASNNIITITASDGSRIFYIILPQNITPGTYTIDGSVYSVTYSKYPDNYLTNSGTIKITLHNTSLKQIKGTFSLTAKNNNDAADEITITNGSFEVVYN